MMMFLIFLTICTFGAMTPPAPLRDPDNAPWAPRKPAARSRRADIHEDLANAQAVVAEEIADIHRSDERNQAERAFVHDLIQIRLRRNGPALAEALIDYFDSAKVLQRQYLDLQRELNTFR